MSFLNCVVFNVLFVTILLTVTVNCKKDYQRFATGSTFPDFLFSSKTQPPASSSPSSSSSLSSITETQCRNLGLEDYCNEDDVTGSNNLNNKVNFLLKLDKNDYDSEENVQKTHHQELMEFLTNEMQSTKRSYTAQQTKENLCNCQVKTKIIDLGHSYFPRYLISAVCSGSDDLNGGNSQHKCRRGLECKPIQYQVKVLTYRNKDDLLEKDRMAIFLPEELRPYWKFSAITVAAGCFCSY